MIRLHSTGLNDATILSNIFIDRFMPKANGEFVKSIFICSVCLAARGSFRAFPDGRFPVLYRRRYPPCAEILGV